MHEVHEVALEDNAVFFSMEEGEEEVVIAGDTQRESNLGCEGTIVIQGRSPCAGNN